MAATSGRRSDDVQLLERCARGDALVAEAAKVERTERASDDELAERPSGGRRLLHAMPAETIDKIHVFEAGVTPDDGILIEGVVVVEAGPSALRLEGGKGRHAIGQRRPYDLVEHRVIDIEILAVRVLVLGRRDAAEEVAALGPEKDAGRVDNEIGARHLAAAVDDIDEPFAGSHRKDETGKRRDGASLRSGGVDDDAATDRPAVREGHRRGAPLLPRDRGDSVLHVGHPERYRLAAKRLQQTIRIEPAFMAQA